jgi:hypothetical protein
VGFGRLRDMNLRQSEPSLKVTREQVIAFLEEAKTRVIEAAS